MSNLRVACLGAGYFSQFHTGSWARIPRVSLVGACDSDLSKAWTSGLPPYDDLVRMLDATKPDLLDIIVPPAAHAASIRTALAAGIRTIVCQKPFCLSLEEARAVTAEAEAQGTRLIVHENFRFQPWYRAIRTALDQALLGRLRQVTFRLRPGDGQGPRAYLERQPYFQTMPRLLVHETAVHWIDTFRYLLGEPRSVYADLRQENPVIAGEDAGFVLSEHDDGVRALFDGNRCLDHAADNRRRTMGEAWVEGEAGTLTLSGDGALHHRSFGARTSEQFLPPNRWAGFGGDCVHALQTHVVAGLLDGTPIENEAQEYLRVREIEEAVYASASSGRKVVLGGV